MQYVVVTVWSLAGQMVADVELDLDHDTLASLRVAVEAKTGMSSEHLRFSFGNSRSCQDFAETSRLRVCLGQHIPGASPDNAIVDAPQNSVATQRQRAPLDGIESETDVIDKTVAKER